MNNFRLLIIGGGGAGGADSDYRGGGGAAGAYIERTDLSLNENTEYTIEIGAGAIWNVAGTRGANSYIKQSSTIIVSAEGGGNGGYAGSNGRNATSSSEASGGGGGGGSSTAGTGGTGGTYGNNGAKGGASSSGANRRGGGGGGAGGAGLQGSSGVGGNGGNGLSSDINGTSTTRAGGGGGGASIGGTGGTGGGGDGSSGAGSAGQANTGSGGGGGRSGGGAGGSGIVILRFKTSDINIINSSNGTVTTVGSDTVITWLQNGSFEFELLVAPTVTTQAVSSIDKTTATGNGNITDTGGANATRRGFCYLQGSSVDPTTANSVVYDDGSFGTGAYTKAITGLTPNTTYRVRAYAVNSAGTSYGSTVSFTTLKADESNFLLLF